jgi:hypothetical protein
MASQEGDPLGAARNVGHPSTAHGPHMPIVAVVTDLRL